MKSGHLAIIGAKGHAKVVIDVIEKQGVAHISMIVDDNPDLHGQEFYGYRIMGNRSELLAQRGRCGIEYLIAIGDNHIRAELAAWAETHGLRLAAPAIHPSAQIGRGVFISEGSVLMAGCLVNSDAFIGRNVIVNTGASIDHDCRIGDNTHIAPHATLCGNIVLGQETLIGAGAVIHPNITIGSNVVVGAGSTVLTDIPDGKTVVGTPARIIRP